MGCLPLNRSLSRDGTGGFQYAWTIWSRRGLVPLNPGECAAASAEDAMRPLWCSSLWWPWARGAALQGCVVDVRLYHGTTGADWTAGGAVRAVPERTGVLPRQSTGG